MLSIIGVPAALLTKAPAGVQEVGVSDAHRRSSIKCLETDTRVLGMRRGQDQMTR